MIFMYFCLCRWTTLYKMKLEYLDVTVLFDVLSSTVLSKRSVSVATAEDVSLLRRGNRAVVPKNIYLLIEYMAANSYSENGGNADQLQRCGVWRECVNSSPVRGRCPCSPWSPGAGHQSLYHCPTSPPRHPPVFVASTSYFHTAVRLLGGILCLFPSTPYGWWRGGGRAALKQICLCCRVEKLIENPAWGFAYSAVLVCSVEELLLICFHSSWGLGKKGLKESFLFFRAVLNQRWCKISISEIYVTCIARLLNYRQSWALSCINRERRKTFTWYSS